MHRQIVQRERAAVKAAHQAVGSRGELYELMHRNDLYIPSQKSSIVTIKYMKAVAGGKLYAPTYDEVKLAPWRRRVPSRKEVIRELLREIPDQITNYFDSKSLKPGPPDPNA